MYLCTLFIALEQYFALGMGGISSECLSQHLQILSNKWGKESSLG